MRQPDRDSFNLLLEPCGWINTGYSEKFGIPRQAGMVRDTGIIRFFQGREMNEAVSGLENFSHIWIIWGFSANYTDAGNMLKKPVWKKRVRPPKLGGNRRTGVFATRSPFRPSGLGMSCVRIVSVDYDEKGPEITVEGADMMDGTPVYDIRPYIADYDSVPDAQGRYSDCTDRKKVIWECSVPPDMDMGAKDNVDEILSLDPRPGYHDDTERIYAMTYRTWNIRFRCDDGNIYIVGTETI